MYNFGELIFFAYQAGDGCVKFDGKARRDAAYDGSPDVDVMVEIKQRERQHNGLAGGDTALRSDEHSVGTDTLYDVAKYALFDGIFGDDIRGASWILTSIVFRAHRLVIQLCSKFFASPLVAVADSDVADSNNILRHPTVISTAIYP